MEGGGAPPVAGKFTVSRQVLKIANKFKSEMEIIGREVIEFIIPLIPYIFAVVAVSVVIYFIIKMVKKTKI